MSCRLKVFHKGLILVGVPLLLGLLMISSLFYLLYQSENARRQEVIYRRGAVLTARLVALTVEVPLLLAASMEYKSDKLFSAYQRNIELIKKYTKEINTVKEQCPEIKVDFKEDLQETQAKVISTAEKFAAERNRKYVLDQLVQLSREMNVVSTQASSRMHDMERHGLIETARTRKKQEEIRKLQSYILLGGFLSNILAAFALAIFYRKNLLNRIKQITRNARALSSLEAMKDPLGGSDEIALLDKSFHEMQRRLNEASERERALFENASDLICALDAEMKFLRVNSACKQDLAYDPEALLGESIEKIIDEGELENFQNYLLESREKKRAVSVEAGVRDRLGALRDMLWSLYWSPQELGYFCIAHDLTEQRQLERNREQFLRLMSQDLREPLSAISSAFSKLLAPEGNTLSKEACDKLAAASKNLTRLLDLVDELLHMNERQGNLLVVKKERCKIDELLNEAASGLQALAEEKQINILVNALDDYWEVDRVRIMQVLVNLVSNAVKFSEPGSQIVISVCKNAEAYFECTVADRGRGVPDSQKELIFEKFAQVEAADGKRHSGTGLGLPICKKIIAGHGGKIGVRDGEDAGSVFWFLIPCFETPENPKSLPSPTENDSLHRPDNDVKTKVPAFGPSSLQLDKKKSGGILQFSSRLSLAIKGTILVGLPLLCEIGLVLALSATLQEVDKQRAAELHQRLVSNSANAWMLESVRVLSDLGHEYNEADWSKIQGEMKTARLSRDKLYKLVADDKKQLECLKKADESFITIEKAYADAGRAVQENRSVFLPFSQRHLITPVLLKLCHEMKKIIDVAEKAESAAPDKERTLGRQQEFVLLCGLLANILSSILLAVYFSRDINSRLMVLADNAGRLVSEKTLNERLQGSDEIAELDRVFHESAEKLAALRKKERSILDNSQDLVCIIDAEGNFLSVNPACFRLWGYERTELLQEKSIFDLLGPEDEAACKEKLGLPSDADLRFTMENRVLKKNGELSFMLWSVSKKAGEPTFYCVAHDISARKELESLKKEFLSMVSHDLRSPLTAISGYVQLVRQGTFGEVTGADETALASIAENCRSLVELISDLLDLEKLEAGKMLLQKEEFELQDLLREAMKASSDRDRLKLEYSCELDETVIQADEQRLKQALVSVLNFVLARCGAEKVLLRVENSPGISQLSILENSGLPLSDYERKQLSASDLGSLLESSRVQAAGSRLSLALSARIISEHGGKLSFKRNGDANVYSITLIREKTMDEEDETPTR